MFDLTSSKLLILGVVALIVVGPKELPFLLRTIGKYVGMIRRQANEFRAQFDEAMREAELASIKEDLEKVARDTENTIRAAETTVERDIHAANTVVDHAIKPVTQASPEPARSEPAHSPIDADKVLNGLDAPGDASAVSQTSAHAAVAQERAAATSDTVAQTSAGPIAPIEVATRHELAKTGT